MSGLCGHPYLPQSLVLTRGSEKRRRARSYMSRARQRSAGSRQHRRLATTPPALHTKRGDGPRVCTLRRAQGGSEVFRHYRMSPRQDRCGALWVTRGGCWDRRDLQQAGGGTVRSVRKETTFCWLLSWIPHNRGHGVLRADAMR